MFVFTCLPWFVSRSGCWCPVCQSAWMFASGSPAFCLHLSPNPCVSQSGWWCPALWISVFTCLPVSGSLDGWLHLPPDASIETGSQIKGDLPHWRTNELSSPAICIHVSFVSRTGGWLSSCLPSFVWLVVSRSLDVCLHLSPNSSVSHGCARLHEICLHLSPYLSHSVGSSARLSSLAACVRLFGSLVSLHLSPVWPARRMSLFT